MRTDRSGMQPLPGYEHARIYDGAWIEWSRRGYPTEVSAAEK